MAIQASSILTRRASRIATPRDMTFVGWIDWRGRVKVGAYDATTGRTQTSVVGALYHDDHGSPSILVEPDKRLTVFWSAHNGSALHYRSTLAPEDISTWGPVRTVPSPPPAIMPGLPVPSQSTMMGCESPWPTLMSERGCLS